MWAEAKPIPDHVRGNADAVLNMDRDAVEFLSQQALIRREKIFAANLFTTGKWNTNMTGVAAGPTAGQFLQWNDPASNPIEDIRAGKLAIKQATGHPANTLVLSEPVWLKLIDHPDLVHRLKYDSVRSPALLPVAGQVAWRSKRNTDFIVGLEGGNSVWVCVVETSVLH